jgi:hypothetical protein
LERLVQEPCITAVRLKEFLTNSKMQILNQINKQKAILTAIFIFTLAVSFGFGKVNTASAASCVCCTVQTDPNSGQITNTSCPANESTDQPSAQACFDKCRGANVGTQGFKFDGTFYDNDGNGGFKAVSTEYLTSNAGPIIETPSKGDPDVCGGMSGWDYFNPKVWFNCFLLVVLRFLGWVLAAVATLFAMVVDTKVFDQILGSNKVIYEIWGMVRDTLNIAFILVLLFSAFCTIFQIEKFGYKKILLNLVIMALLVNFSFPIARVIIDFSNVIMYYFIKNLGLSTSSDTIFTQIAQNSALNQILTINNVTADTSFLLAAVIFTFIFLVTIFVVTLLLLIRIVVLALLVIFSSVAFVGSLVPFLSTHASKWWDNLFKYAFFGPIMIFMIVVSLRMMNTITSLGGQFSKIAVTQTPGEGASNIAAMAFFTLPIVILWVGLSFAKQMSIAGAGAITGVASKFITGALKSASGASFVSGTWGAYRTRRKEADKDSWRNRIGTWAGGKQDLARSQLPGRGGKDAQLRYQRDLAQKVEAEAKRNDTANASTSDLRNLARTGNRFERAAAIQELANRGQATAAQLNNVRHAFGETSQVFNQLAAKIKAYDPVAAFSTQLDANGNVTAFDEERAVEHMRSNQFDAKKLSADALGNANFMRLAARNGAISTKDLEELRGKSIYHERNIRDSLTTIAGEQEFNRLAQYNNTVEDSRQQIADIQHELDTNVALTAPERQELQQQQVEAREVLSRNEVLLRNARAVQVSHFAQTGDFHASINDDTNPSHINARAQIIGRLDKDTAKRMSTVTVTNRSQELADNIRPNKYKDIVLNLDSSEVQRQLNTEMRAAAHAAPTASATARSVNRLATNDNMLQHIHN